METDGLAQTMRSRWTQDPARPALGFGDTWYDWQWVSENATHIDDTLASVAYSPHAPVAVIARNRPGQAGTILGLMATGRPAVVISSIQSPDGMAADIVRLGVLVVLGSADDLGSDAVAEALRKTGALGVTLVEHGPPRFSIVTPVPSEWPSQPRDRDALVVMLTSGTTGTPKRLTLGRMATLSAMADLTAMLGECEQPGQISPSILFQPLANISGMYLLMLLAAEGRPALLLERFRAAEWGEAVRSLRPSWLWLPPAAIQMVLDADIDPTHLSSARALRTGSAPLGDSVRARFEQRFSIPVLSHYGATEFCGIVTSLSPDDVAGKPDRSGSVGRARPGVRLQIVDSMDGTVVGPGELGILEVQADRLGPGWTRTTDLAVLDREGFLTLHGRADDAINRGGFKVLAGRVADALRGHPAIADAAVLGLADDRLGQVPVAILECRPGVLPPSVEDLAAFSRGRLLAYQVPARFLIVPSLPRTGTMKIDRQAALKLFASTG
ncbi:AMP-binding protein [Roseomonas sp. JC162]|uniref:AMP-binding protein n=1 Tax=Neoroseomonas marina TaxID=1232220 RepID=A0A848EM56_9PROT|nr:AMP-binding protein [Neoroseomonas marina]NMJ44447.1 AMP-binding protein [Neoroseomonas marina]